MSTIASTPIDDLRRPLRAGDTDRDATAAILAQALALGYLTMAEFEVRSGQALGAQTLGELADLLVDLPVAALSGESPEPARPPRASRAAVGLRIHLLAYLCFVTLAVVIWSVTSVAFGADYFWPIWPALGGGIGLVSHAIPTRAGCRSDARSASAVIRGCGQRAPLSRE